jgi:hypothetical protein
VQDPKESNKSCTMPPPKRKESAKTLEKKKGSAITEPNEKSKQESSPSLEKKKTKMGEEEPTQQVNLFHSPRPSDFHDPLKLLVFNVHGTLLDCSLMVDKNPNPKLRPTFRTKNRRVLIHPWMSEFLSKCFKNFMIGFWGSKNKAYMDEMVLAMLGRVKSREPLQLAFVWFQKECEELQWCNN